VQGHDALEALIGRVVACGDDEHLDVRVPPDAPGGWPEDLDVRAPPDGLGGLPPGILVAGGANGATKEGGRLLGDRAARAGGAVGAVGAGRNLQEVRCGVHSVWLGGEL